MKKIFFFTFSLILSNKIICQNVGVGTTTPVDKLSIITSGSNYGITHSNGTVTIGTYLGLNAGQFGTKTNHPLQFFTNNAAPQITLLQNGNVGIGITAPTVKFDVDGNVITEGSAAGFRFNDRTDNTKGYQWYSSAGNAYLYRQHAPAGSVLSVYANETMLLNPSAGNVGINYTDPALPAFPLDINQSNDYRGLRIQNSRVGSSWDLYSFGYLYFSRNNQPVAFIGPNGDFVQTSDARFKKDINRIGTVLDKVMALKPSNYKYIANNPDNKISTGFIAQEVMPLFPELVSDFKSPQKDTTDKNIYYGINYAGFSVIAIKAIQEQQKEIELLKEEIEMLKQNQNKILNK